MVTTKMRGMNYTYQHFTKNYTVIVDAKVEESNCLACHLGDVKYYADTPKLNNTEKIDHFKAIKDNQPCLSCHIEMGHEEILNLTSEFRKTWR
jgi:nitrate/TMAO reductase-like tetraheme cytochrome c subunit